MPASKHPRVPAADRAAHRHLRRRPRPHREGRDRRERDRRSRWRALRACLGEGGRGTRAGPASEAVKAVPSAPVAEALTAVSKKLPGKPKSRPKGAKRSRAAIARTTADLLAEIVAHPGQRIEQIAKAMKTSTKELTLPAKKLLGQGKIKSAGVKRATTYSPA